MNFPSATNLTAFFAGLSSTVLAGVIDVFKFREQTLHSPDSPALLLFFLAYLFASILFFVIDVRNIAPNELKTKIPLVYFPTNKNGIGLLLKMGGRMLIGLLGVAVGVAVLLLVAKLTHGAV